MILNTRTGCFVTGVLTADAVFSLSGENGKPGLTFWIRYCLESEKLIEMVIRGDSAMALQEIFHAGDTIAAAGEILEYIDDCGNTRRRLECQGDLWPGILWWAKHAEEITAQEWKLYSGETLSDYMPSRRKRAESHTACTDADTENDENMPF